MTNAEIVQTIAKLRRDMPRNQVAMDLCAACERLMASAIAKPEPLTRAQIQKNYRDRRRAEGKAK